IAAINLSALATLLIGYRFIRQGEIKRHRFAMLTAFGLILLFLVFYLWKVGGGYEKSIVIKEGMPLAAYAGIVELIYFAMLAIHIILSVIAVPVVLHAAILGLTHDPSELPRTVHPRVGRIAVAAWSLSLGLGLITYLLLNHVYGSEPREASMVLLFLPATRSLWKGLTG
ncbi:MAG: DUF420 domain-containing protein, partial [Halobacteriaceae archaeon]